MTFGPASRRGAGGGACEELIELETQLNHYWSTEPLFTAREIAEEVREPADLMPTRDVLNAQAIERAVDQGRFLSSGTAGVVGWLRNQKRYGEAIAILEAQFALPEVCALRNRSHGYAFECLLNNGFGNYADSSDPEHHRLGARAIHVIESFMTPTTTMVQWQFSCVLAQAGESGKALDYVEAAVANRASARRMARDGDLASVVDHPRFVALLDAERSSAA